MKYLLKKYRKIPLIRPPVYKLLPPPIYAPQTCYPISIPNISPPYIRLLLPPPPDSPNIGPPHLSSLRTKNITLLQVFSCILLVQFIYLVLHEWELCLN